MKGMARGPSDKARPCTRIHSLHRLPGRASGYLAARQELIEVPMQRPERVRPQRRTPMCKDRLRHIPDPPQVDKALAVIVKGGEMEKGRALPLSNHITVALIRDGSYQRANRCHGHERSRPTAFLGGFVNLAPVPQDYHTPALGACVHGFGLVIRGAEWSINLRYRGRSALARPGLWRALDGRSSRTVPPSPMVPGPRGRLDRAPRGTPDRSSQIVVVDWHDVHIGIRWDLGEILAHPL